MKFISSTKKSEIINKYSIIAKYNFKQKPIVFPISSNNNENLNYNTYNDHPKINI